ncbi:MAG: SDR family oxidoreductase [Pseudomonadota bacterium]
MKILLIGSSGMLGQSLLKCTWAKQHEWVSVARRIMIPNNQLQLRPLSIDLNMPQLPEFWEAELEGVEVVINCLGIIRETPHQSFSSLHHLSPEVIFKAAEKKGVRHIIQVSALGAEQATDKLFSHYHRSKKAADDVLKTLSVAHTTLYPSVILSPTGQSTQLFLSLAALPVTSYPNIEAPLQPIAVEDVLATIEKLIDTIAKKETCPEALILVGTTAVTLQTLLSLFKQALGLPIFMIPVPLFLNMLLAECGEWSTRIPFNREMLAMLKAGNASNDQYLPEWLGQPLTPLSVAIQKVVIPGSLVRVRFEYSCLHVGLVFIWCWTACMSLYNYTEGVTLMSQLSAHLPHTGIPEVLYPWAIVGGAALDAAVGLGIAFKKRQALWISLAVLLVYTVIITVGIPEWWLDPLGRVSKNIPIAMMTWVVLMNTPVTERNKRKLS